MLQKLSIKNSLEHSGYFSISAFGSTFGILHNLFVGVSCGLLFLANIFFAPVVFAEDLLAALPTEEDFFGDIPIVLSVTRLAQPKSDAPASITIIDRAMIEASGIREIPQLLRLVPGFQVGHDSSSILAPRQTPVTYHGYSDAYSRKMQVLVDGRSVYEPFLGGVRWSELGLVLDDIDRIEVIRGPNATSYGSNAVLGVVNIITRHPSLDTGTTIGVDASSTGYQQGFVRYSSDGKKYDYRLTASYLQDAGFEKVYDYKNTTGFSYRGELKLNNEDSLDIFLGMNQGLRQLGDGDAQYPYHDRGVNNSYQHLKWTRRKSVDNEYSLQFYHNYSNFDNNYVGNFGALTQTNASSKTNRWDIEFQHVLSMNNDFRFVWGAGARVDEALAPGWFTSTEVKRNVMQRLFANGEWRPSSKWTFNAGAMFEQTTVVGRTISPRLAANYHVDENQSTRAAVSRGYRNPALFEENANTIVNLGNNPLIPLYFFYSDGNIKPENVTNYELGYLRESKKGNIAIDVKIFLMQFRDSIAYPVQSTSSVTTKFENIYQNGGESDIYGAEIQTKFKPSRQTVLTTSYAYSQHKGWYLSKILPSEISYDTGRTTPNHTFSFLVDHKLSDQWAAGLFTGIARQARIGKPPPAIAQTACKGLMKHGHQGIYPLSIHNVGNLLAMGDIPLLLLTAPLTALAVAGLSNAYNMLDGIDGLAAATMALPLMVLYALAVQSGHPLTDYLLLLIIPIVVFLLFNLGPNNRLLPKIFLGDSGSLTMGLLITAALIVASQGEQAIILPVTALWLVAVPLMDMLATMLRRARHGHSLMEADRSHLHHTLMALGFSSRQTLVLLVAYAAACAMLGLALEGTKEYLSLVCFCLLFFGHCSLVLRPHMIGKLLGRQLRAHRGRAEDN